MKLAFNLPDGTVTIIGAAPKEQLERAVGTLTMVDGVPRKVLTDEEYRQFIIQRNVEAGVIPPGATDLVELDVPDDWAPPLDRAFRYAWKKDGQGFSYDMGRAREVTRDRLRRERETALRDLDVLVTRALAMGDAAQASTLEAERQRLRDITTLRAIAEARTVDQLKAVTLETRDG